MLFDDLDFFFVFLWQERSDQVVDFFDLIVDFTKSLTVGVCDDEFQVLLES